jgi:hypothetical protein
MGALCKAAEYAETEAGSKVAGPTATSGGPFNGFVERAPPPSAASSVPERPRNPLNEGPVPREPFRGVTACEVDETVLALLPVEVADEVHSRSPFHLNCPKP